VPRRDDGLRCASARGDSARADAERVGLGRVDALALDASELGLSARDVVEFVPDDATEEYGV